MKLDIEEITNFLKSTFNTDMFTLEGRTYVADVSPLFDEVRYVIIHSVKCKSVLFYGTPEKVAEDMFNHIKKENQLFSDNGFNTSDRVTWTKCGVTFKYSSNTGYWYRSDDSINFNEIDELNEKELNYTRVPNIFLGDSNLRVSSMELFNADFLNAMARLSKFKLQGSTFIKFNDEIVALIYYTEDTMHLLSIDENKESTYNGIITYIYRKYIGIRTDK